MSSLARRIAQGKARILRLKPKKFRTGLPQRTGKEPRPSSNSIAKGNRWGGAHNDERAAARKLRQLAAIDPAREQRAERGQPSRTRGFVKAGGLRFNYSRRGRLVLAVSEQ